ncbi:MAG: hypothetical protein ABI661_04560 [Gammaproteobacteria bacterium]
MTLFRWMAVAGAGCALAACGFGSGPPRPASVPDSARWAGNIEGGTWLDCQPVPHASLRFSCRAYFETTGAIIAEGPYVLRQRSWNQEALRSEYTEPAVATLPAYEAFDGRWITLKDNAVLLPDGVITFPSGASHGKRQEYRLGVEVGAASRY